jgi:hypothetical protein
MPFKFNPFTDKLDIVETGSGSPTVVSLSGNDGIPVPASAGGNINIVGGSNVTVSGNPGTNTETITLTGLSVHDVLVGGAGGASITPVSPSTAGFVLTSNGVAADPSFQAAAKGVNTWNVIGASQTLAVQNGYFCTTGAALSLALPAVSALGDTITVVLDGSTSWTITQPNAGTRIRIANNQTTLGVTGSLASTAQGDTVTLICETANARWVVVPSFIGNITVT